MRGPEKLRPRLLAATACLVFAGMSAAAGGADGTSLKQQAARVRSANASLAQRAQRSLLDLYSLEARLRQARVHVAALQTEAAHVRAERASVRRQIRAAQSTVRASQRQLELRLRALYEQTQVDPIAAVLGASSIDEAITSLDDLDRSARLDRRITGQAQRARASLKRLSASLASRSARLRALAAEAQRTFAALAAEQAARTQYIRQLRTQQRLNAAEVARLDRRASAAAARTPAVSAVSAVTSAPATVPSVPPAAAPAATHGTTLTVVATGYSLSGSTSSGMPTGWGVAAVDPSVIPLGTHMSVPGYGDAVAADTGSAVQGAVIDLWFPTDAQALAWGRRTVSITLQ